MVILTVMVPFYIQNKSSSLSELLRAQALHLQ
jgi:hypothetical protein